MSEQSTEQQPEQTVSTSVEASTEVDTGTPDTAEQGNDTGAQPEGDDASSAPTDGGNAEDGGSAE